jgi:hypothetical protein
MGNAKRIKSITTARKSMLKLGNCNKMAVKCCTLVQCGKYSPAKFANFVLICIPHGKMHHIWAESGANSR